MTDPLIRPAGPVHWIKANDDRHTVSDTWIPAPEHESQPRPWWRYCIAIGAILAVTALIFLAARYAGTTAADGFGPLLPTATPYPTPHPDGWTFDGS